MTQPTMPIPPRLHTDRLTIGYRGAPALLTDQSLTVRAGEFVCLLGANGVGKSTLLGTLTGVIPPRAGRVLLGDADLGGLHPGERARRVAVVLTERVQPGLLTAREVVALGRHPYTGWSGRLATSDEDAVDAAIAAVRGESLAHRPLSDLSDGERQRIMIARALAQAAPLILLDEPTAFLDLPRRIEIMRLLVALTREVGRAILISTHELDLALRLADRLWLMPGDGTLIDGTPADLIARGDIQRTFSGDGFTFDPARGAFQLT
jgi:iron complex transport system ATP-binding protein